MNPLARDFCKRLGFESKAICTTLALFLYSMVSVTSGNHQYHTNLFLGHVPAPEFLPGTLNVTVRPGDAALLPCSVRYLGTKKVVWRNIKEDRFLTIGDATWGDDSDISLDYSREPDHVTNWDLVVRNVKPKDAGIYECQITSVAGHTRKVMLNVVGSPITKTDISYHSSNRHRHNHHSALDPNRPVSICGQADMNQCLISITGKKYVNLGDRLELVCNATGGPRIPDEIDWFKTGNKIDSDKSQYRHAVITKFQSISDRSFISNLIIKHATLEDTGDYICRSSRNDIANLKVTVLHTETDNKRRESSKQWDHTDPSGESNNSASDSSCPTLPLLVMAFLTLLWTHQRPLIPRS